MANCLVQFTMRGDGDSSVIKENVTDYRVGETCALATCEMTFHSAALGDVHMDVEWFSGIDRDDDDNVSYYFGVSTTVVVRLECCGYIYGAIFLCNLRVWICCTTVLCLRYIHEYSALQ